MHTKTDRCDTNTTSDLFSLRTWAIYQANFYILIFLCPLAYGSFALNILSLLNRINIETREFILTLLGEYQQYTQYILIARHLEYIPLDALTARVCGLKQRGLLAVS